MLSCLLRIRLRLCDTVIYYIYIYIVLYTNDHSSLSVESHDNSGRKNSLIYQLSAQCIYTVYAFAEMTIYSLVTCIMQEVTH